MAMNADRVDQNTNRLSPSTPNKPGVNVGELNDLRKLVLTTALEEPKNNVERQAQSRSLDISVFESSFLLAHRDSVRSYVKSSKEKDALSALLGDNIGNILKLGKDSPAGLLAVIRQSFGDDISATDVLNLLERIQRGEVMVHIRLVDNGTLTGAKGAYYRDEDGTPTILLSNDLIGDPNDLRSVVFEELGHLIDDQLNSSDTIGDEGRIFSLGIMSGAPLTEPMMLVLKRKNDKGTLLSVEGNKIEVEFSSKTQRRQALGSVGADGKIERNLATDYLWYSSGQVLSQPEKGTVFLNSNHELEFDTNGAFDHLGVGKTETVRFTLIVLDSNGDEQNVEFRVRVTGSNQAPSTGSSREYFVDEGGSLDSHLPQASDVDDIDEESLEYELSRGIAENDGSLEVRRDGTFLFTPGNNFNHLDNGDTKAVTFRYRVKDQHGRYSEESEVTVVVRGKGNVTEDVERQSYLDDLDSQQIVSASSVLSRSVAKPGASDNNIVYSLNAGSVPAEYSAYLQMSEDGSYTFRPGTAFDELRDGDSKKFTFTYTTSNSDGDTAIGTVRMTVIGTNQAPVASEHGNEFGIAKDKQLQDVLPGAADADLGDELVYSVVGRPDSQLKIDSDGSFSFTPDSRYENLTDGKSLDYTFRYKVTDSTGAESEPKTVTITVNGVGAEKDQDSEVAQRILEGLNREETVQENGVLRRNVSKVDGTSLSNRFEYSLGSRPDEGKLTFENGNYTFESNGDFDDLRVGQTRNVTFTYIVKDMETEKERAGTVSIVVTGRNQAPKTSDEPHSFSIYSNKHLNANVPRGSDTDSNSELRYMLSSPDSTEQLLWNEDGSFEFNPNEKNSNLTVGQQRTFTFSYYVQDETGAKSKLETATITIKGANEQVDEVADNRIDGYFTNLIQEVETTESGKVSRNLPLVSAEHGERIKYRLTDGGGPESGRFTLSEDGSYTYDPNGELDGLAEGETREVNVTYEVIDEITGRLATGVLTFTVRGINQAPELDSSNLEYQTSESSIFKGQLPAAVDPDSPDLTHELVAEPNKGKLTLLDSGSFEFEPGSDFNDLKEGQTREVTFSYRVSDDAGGASNTRSVTISVVGENTNPRATDDKFADVKFDQKYEGDLGANDSPGDGKTVFSGPTRTKEGGVLEVNNNGSFEYTPPTGRVGEDSFVYTITDENGDSHTAKVELNVMTEADSVVSDEDMEAFQERQKVRQFREQVRLAIEKNESSLIRARVAMILKDINDWLQLVMDFVRR